MPWFKGNIHSHTTNSDGDSPPQHVASWYKDNNYDFLVLSDHNHLSILDDAENNNNKWPLLIPGEEITVRTIGLEPAALHIGGIGLSEVIMPGSYESNVEGINDIVSKINKQEGLASINHPNYQWWVSAQDIKHSSENIWAFEIFNGHMHANNQGSLNSMSTEEIWDDILSSGKFIYGVAADDSHHFTEEFNRNRSNPGRGWLIVNSESLSQKNIINSLRKGNFYSSIGVELKTLELSKEKIFIEINRKTKPPQDKTEKFSFSVIHDKGVVFHELQNDHLEISTEGIKNYYRVVINSSNGEKAWTQPVIL
tara:strand:- start:7508 stop:8437 length:930 start_codon:yes stop_codon:yes gene_type:complete